ncbi:MAG: hypothetical protein JRN67_13120 [Nitrososphaerota archaeon]|nr:hypothetical protein [Nitrososphaerota archaeon]MDG6999265.1 hypothetical protein [Nitrososphaerota archaeon]
MPSEDNTTRVPYFSTSRFGPGTIGLLIVLSIATIVLYRIGTYFYAGMLLVSVVLIFGVKSIEVLRAGRPEQRSFVGKKCKVVVEVNKEKRGVVKLIRNDGSIDPELWSAEANTSIGIGEEARVVGINSIILLVEPITHVNEESGKDSNTGEQQC